MITTADVKIPASPLERVIGQEEAVSISRICAKQKRHLLLVGVPGTGKSMIALALASILPKATQEISVMHNFERPERPIIEVRTCADALKEKHDPAAFGKPINPEDLPVHVSERLGFRCRSCARLSRPSLNICPGCGSDKYKLDSSPFDDLLLNIDNHKLERRVQTTRLADGKEKAVAYELTPNEKVRMISHEELKKLRKMEEKKPRKVILPSERNQFVQATGANEAELLGDVKHDPYGEHSQIGSPPYQRVVPGAVHEAHEGVLFIDEITTLGSLQRYLLTAMQEKKFSITGKNASSTGAIVRVDDVPCEFILVCASNINDLRQMLPALRSRIDGNGYEVLMNSHMPDTPANREKLVQFMAQEIAKDSRIPHADVEAVESILNEARKMARDVDNAKNSLTLRLRKLAGLLKLAGDMAVVADSDVITKEFVAKALKRARSAEEQLDERYDNWWQRESTDFGARKRQPAGAASSASEFR